VDRQRTAGEVRSLLSLAWPLAVAQGGYMLMGVVDTAIVGRVSPLHLAAVGLGTGFCGVVMMFGIGAGMGVEPLIGQAHGAGEVERTHRWFWQALWVVAFLAVPMAAATWALTYVFEPAGISNDIALVTREYVIARLIGIPFNCWAVVQRSYLSNVGRPRVALLATLVANVANVFLDLAFVLGWFGMPAMGAVGCGLVTSVCQAMIAIVQGYSIRKLWDAESPGRKRRVIWPELKKVKRALKLGWPIGSHMMVEVGIFTLMSLLIGRLGEIPLAAHQIALTMASLAFLVVVGVSSATTARVGNHIGADDQPMARRAGWLGVSLGAVIMSVTGATFIFAGAEIAALFTPDAAVREVGAHLLQIGGAFAVVDGVQVTATGALRGTGETRWPFFANVTAHWLIGLPAALYLAVVLDMGAAGYWWGLTVGLALVAVAVSFRFWVVSNRPISRLERSSILPTDLLD